MHRRIQPHVKRRHNSHANNERAWNAALRVAHLAGHHVEIVPAVVGPQRCYQRRHESGHAAFGANEFRGEIVPATRRCREAEQHDDDNHHYLQAGKNELEFSCFFYAQIIQPGNQQGGGNCDQMAVLDLEDAATRELPVRQSVIQDFEPGESAQHPYQAGGYGGNGCWLGDQEPGPGVQKSHQPAVGVADVNIFAARLRLHRAQFGVSHGAEKREKATHDPRQINQLGRSYRLHHLGGNQEDAAADDGAHHHRAGMAHAQLAQQPSGLG